MALDVTSLTTGLDAGNSATFTTASITPSADSLILITIATSAHAGSVTPTVTGNGITYALVVENVEGSRYLGLFRGLNASPSASLVTFDFGADVQNECVWSVDEWSGHDTGGTNGADAIVQSDSTGTGNQVSNWTTTLSSFADATNVAYGAIYIHQRATSQTPGSGFTELVDYQLSEGNVTWGTEWMEGEGTAVSHSWSGGGSVCNSLACEIAIAPDSSSQTTRDLQDTATFSDDLARDFWGDRLGADIRDVFTFSDSMVADLILIRELNDTVATFADSLNRQCELLRRPQDTNALTDDLVRDLINIRELQDTSTFSDALDALLINIRELQDSVTFSDALARDQDLVRLLEDTNVLVENMTRTNTGDVETIADHHRFKLWQNLRRWRLYKPRDQIH